MTITTPAPMLERDRWGRPLVVPPGGGDPVAYSRCTSYVDCIEDKTALDLWKQRQVALGLASRPDLLLAVSAHRDDKRALNGVCKDALEAAAASAAATRGTALHSLTEQIDRGQELPAVLPDDVVADLDAYKAATSDLTHELIEQFTVLDNLKIGGTPDRVVEYNGNRYIADLKTGSIDLGTLKIAMQLAVYSRSHTYDIATHTRGIHEADTSRGIIIHLPAGAGVATLHWVDLEAGWYAVQVAKQVREKRALKFKDLTEPFGPVTPIAPGTVPGNTAMTRARNAKPTLEQQIRACASADTVRALWSANAHDWTDELTAVAKTHIANLEVTP